MDKAIVMIHGMFAGAWCWEHYKTYFEEKGYRCFTPTLRYHDMNPNDEPDPRLGTVSLRDYADDLEKYIRQIDAPVILMGHSMGGLLAQMLASRNLADAAVLLAPASPHGILALTPSVVRSFWSMMMTWGFWKKPGRQTFNEAAYSSLGLLPADQKMKEFDKFVYESGRAAFEIGFWYLDPGKASHVDESNVTCPVLIIAGTEDRMTPVSVVRKIAGKYNAVAEYMEFENHGHWLIGESGWEKIAQYSSDWLHNTLIQKRLKVEGYAEQRKHRRIRQHALIAFSSSGSESFHRGEMLNYSRGGLLFTSAIEISPGAEIMIEWIDGAPDGIDVQSEETIGAEVIWHKQSKENISYDIGARFTKSVTG
jgi:pimeloyl-ACP methyl ester carboxylesterase